jgi:hypothetical protein
MPTAGIQERAQEQEQQRLSWLQRGPISIRWRSVGFEPFAYDVGGDATGGERDAAYVSSW